MQLLSTGFCDDPVQYLAAELARHIFPWKGTVGLMVELSRLHMYMPIQTSFRMSPAHFSTPVD